MKVFAIAVFCLFSLSAMASCPKHSYADPAQLRVTGDSLMIVTHASSNDDGRLVTKYGVDEAIRFAKKKRIPVIYLQDDRPHENYFMEDCNPDGWVFSGDGSLLFDVSPAHVYVVGGHLEECLSRTLHDVLSSWAKQPGRNLTLTYFMDGIFSNGKGITENDPYYKDYLRFMGIVNYSRPAGEHFPKMSLLETMGIILSETSQINYLERMLPHYERTLGKDYRVEIRMSDSRTKVLQRGQGARPPVLNFEFVNSADALEPLRL